MNVLDATPATPPANIARHTITEEPEEGMGRAARSEPNQCLLCTTLKTKICSVDWLEK